MNRNYLNYVKPKNPKKWPEFIADLICIFLLASVGVFILKLTVKDSTKDLSKEIKDSIKLADKIKF